MTSATESYSGIIALCNCHPRYDYFLYTNRQPRDWSLSWGGGGNIYGWGHNHRGQLGGLEGSRIKTPQICENLSSIRPVQICGGEQTLFCLTAEGKVCLCKVLFQAYVAHCCRLVLSNTRDSLLLRERPRERLLLIIYGSFIMKSNVNARCHRTQYYNVTS